MESVIIDGIASIVLIIFIGVLFYVAYKEFKWLYAERKRYSECREIFLKDIHKIAESLSQISADNSNR